MGHYLCLTSNNHKKTSAPTCRRHFYLAGVLGFEPRSTVLETVALPLNYTPMERKTRLELATPTLARLCSTTELLPLKWRPRTDLNRRSPPWQGGILNQLNYWADFHRCYLTAHLSYHKTIYLARIFYSLRVALKLSPTCCTTCLIIASISSSFKVFALSWKVRLKAMDLQPEATCLPV